MGARERMVHHPERLLRRGGLVALRDVIVRIGEVERTEERRKILAIDAAVECAARLREIRFEIERLAADLGGIQASGDAQHTVAHGLKVEATALGAPAQVIVGILGQAFGAHVDRLQEGAGEDDGADEFLHGPFVLHEGRGEVFKQLGVLRQRRPDAVVARGLDQAAADEFGPDAIGHHASGERVRLAGDGVGHVETSAAFGEFLDLTIGQDGRELARDGLAWSGGAAADEDDAFDCRGFVQEHHCVGRALGARGLEADDLDLEVVARVAVGDVVCGN